LILSRHPIIATHTHQFTTRATASDALAAKGCIHALLQLPGDKRLDVFSAHTQASYTYVADAATEEIQRSQMAEISSFMHECMEDRSVAVFGGDLNVDACQNAATKSYDRLLEIMGRGFDSCTDVLMQGKTAQPETSIQYTYNKKTGVEIVKDGYLNRPSVIGEDGACECSLVPGGTGCCAFGGSVDEPQTAEDLMKAGARFDYVLLLQKTRSDGDKSIECSGSSAYVEPFHVDNLKEGDRESLVRTQEYVPFSHLSDHFGVVAELNCS
jgi:hypothetical protein